jgi:predicted small secreted protein
MIRMMTALVVIPGMAFRAGCNTLQGVGKDLEKAGEAVRKAGSN